MKVNYLKEFLKQKVVDFITSKSIPDTLFVMLFNIFLLIKRKKYHIEKTHFDNINNPNFLIRELESDTVKYFGFKKQGFMAFRNGIKQRGKDIGNSYLLKNVTFKDNDIIFDVGANTGDLRIYFENLNLNYFAFEPGKIEFNCLKLNCPETNIFPFALGDKDGEIDFFYNPEFGDSSIIRMKNFQKKHKVNVIKIDSFIKAKKIKKIKLLKLESEGYEFEILQGAKKSLNKIEFISADLGFERGIDQESTLPIVSNFLIKENFEIIDINSTRLIVLFKNKLFD